MEAIDVPQVYVAHVKVGYEERAAFIEQLLARHNMPFAYMLDGDISDLSVARMSDYFDEQVLAVGPCPYVSCAMKHILIYEDIVRRNLSGALILEDDIDFGSNFVEVFNKTQQELRSRPDLNADRHLVSYENSSLRWIPKRWLKRGQHLYPGMQPRCTASYYISGLTAKDILDSIKVKKLDCPIDDYLLYVFRAGKFPVYWCEPAIAEQGSMNGRFHSGINTRKEGLRRRVSWTLDKTYRRIRWHVQGALRLDRKAW